jgi:CheY-like chemotaxis protein
MHQILIVEDDSDIVESLRYSFRREGFLPVAAESGEKGFKLALREKKPPSLMEQFPATKTLIIELLLIVSLVALAVRRLRIPYTVALVVVGSLITFQQPLEMDLTAELILSLFIPPLVFEAAFHLEFKALRENWLPIVALDIKTDQLRRFRSYVRPREILEAASRAA